MSSQKGNTKRTRPQKYQNRAAFKNNLHDTSKRTKEINSLEILEVCDQCKGVIEWKIKYKKYKPLTQPKTCSNCQQKSIRHAYYTLCDDCGITLGVCCKCRQSKEVSHRPLPLKPKQEVILMKKKILDELPERKRRAFCRYVDTFYDIEKRAKFLKISKIDVDNLDEENIADGEDTDNVDEKESTINGEEKEKSQGKLEVPNDFVYCKNYLEKITQYLDELRIGIIDDARIERLLAPKRERDAKKN